MTLRKNEKHARAEDVDAHTPLNAPAAAGPGRDEPMSAGQRAILKQLAEDAYEPDAFDPTLTRAEAARRIHALEAKIALMSEPPHTA
ncbi:MAG TPA: DUF3072 domain-containing protein [Pseudolabrys sp.]|nr:DUF3072 domain-containing protein [Pseudolabrys sp.]